MRRSALPLVVAVTVVLSACMAPTAPATDTARPTESTQSPTEPTRSPTEPTQSPGAERVGVEYVVSSGTVPEHVESLTVTLQVVFVEDPADVGPCWRETFAGPYRPTTTPIAPPSGDCYRSRSVTLDLAALDGERSLDRFTAPGRFTAGHALIATNVTATDRNGSAVSGIRGASDKRLAVVEGAPAGPYRVTLSLESYADRDYDYWFVAA